MEKSWFRFYPKGVPTELPPSPYPTLPDLLGNAFERYGDLRAFTSMGKTFSFKEIDKASAAFGAYLQHKLGLVPGDRVAVQIPNLLSSPIALFGILRAGLIVVNTNPLYTPREMEHQFKDSGAKAIIILENFAANLQSIIGNTGIPPENVILVRIGDCLPTLKGAIVNFVVKNIKKMVPAYHLPRAKRLPQVLSEGAALTLKPHGRKPEDLAFLQYTGGTTGISKGAMLTHRNVVVNMQQICLWMGPLLKPREEIIVTALPLYHIFSLTVNCFAFMDFGAENVLITNPRDFPAFVKELKKHKFTVFSGVNTLFNALCNREDFRALNFKSLKLSVAGAMALQRAVHDKWVKTTGTPVVEGYGLTETSPVACVNPVDGGARVGTIGIPVTGTDVKLVDDAGNEVPIGTAGEICIKGPQVMAGYWQRKEETDQIMLPGGWFKTGDVGERDADGFFKIVDRKKDMIIVSGFKVYPNEVEDVAVMHPKVFEAAAVGIHDDNSGEVVKVFIVKKDESLTIEELMAHFKANLTNYKVPKAIEYRKELPKTNVGKVVRRLLRDEAK